MKNSKRAFCFIITSMLTLSFLLLPALAPTGAEAQDPGADVYAKKCKTCHADDGTGATKAGQMLKTPDLNTAEWKKGKSAAEVEKTLREGLGKMKAFEGKMSDGDLKAVSEYVVVKFAK